MIGRTDEGVGHLLSACLKMQVVLQIDYFNYVHIPTKTFFGHVDFTPCTVVATSLF